MKKLLIWLIISIVVIISALSAAALGLVKYSQSSGKSIVPVSDSKKDEPEITDIQMKEDLDFLVKTLKQNHYSRFSVIGEKQEKVIEEAYKKITKPMNYIDFYIIANEITASINDAHTTLRYTTAYRTGIRLPFRWLNEGMIVSGNVDQLLKGDKIISIGGKTEDQLYEAMDKLIPAENKYWIKDRAPAEIIAEPVLRHLNLINSKGNVDIELERNGTINKFSLPVEPFSPVSSGGQPPDWVRWNIEKDYSLGILTLDKCTNDETYKKTVNDFFKAIKENNIKTVALDLRRNTGGSSTVTETFLQYLDVDIYRSIGGGIRQNNKTPEKDLIFNGDLYVLTSFRTFSAANLFTITLKDNRLAKVLGEPTGNATTRYGEVKSYKLPNSSFDLGVATKRFSRPDTSLPLQDAIYPDIEVYTTRDDIINGRDPQLERLRLECEKSK